MCGIIGLVGSNPIISTVVKSLREHKVVPNLIKFDGGYIVVTMNVKRYLINYPVSI